VWLSPEGEVGALSLVPIVCHARAVARRLDIAGFAALDVPELFGFVRPAQFCVPTPRGLGRRARPRAAAQHLDAAGLSVICLLSAAITVPQKTTAR
jgi:ATP-dependent DNA helicase DinG